MANEVVIIPVTEPTAVAVEEESEVKWLEDRLSAQDVRLQEMHTLLLEAKELTPLCNQQMSLIRELKEMVSTQQATITNLVATSSLSQPPPSVTIVEAETEPESESAEEDLEEVEPEPEERPEPPKLPKRRKL